MLAGGEASSKSSSPILGDVDSVTAEDAGSAGETIKERFGAIVSEGTEESLLCSKEEAEGDSATLVATMTKLLKAQTEVIAAQAQVAVTQHLPPLKSFTGEDMDTEEKTFDRWFELFEERANFAGWSPAQRLIQMKVLLDKTALKAFGTFPKADRDDYGITALGKR